MKIDSLVRGRVGSTERVAEARVYRVSAWGWVAGIDTEGRQVIIHDAEIIGDPRPMNQRKDIPERLQS